MKKKQAPAIYSLRPEHEARFPEWSDKWIANAMSTRAMDDGEREIMRSAVAGLYQSAGLEPPPTERIVFVSSPFVGAFAAGFASWIWWMREHPARDATRAATCAATDDATRAQALLKEHRESIDRLDAILVYTLAERFKHTQSVGRLKAAHELPPSDPAREARQIERLERLATEADLDPEFAKKFLTFIISEVIRHHEKLQE